MIINKHCAESKVNHDENEIAKTWISGQTSVTLVIEKSIAKEYGLTNPQFVVLERRKEGILIRKLKDL